MVQVAAVQVSETQEGRDRRSEFISRGTSNAVHSAFNKLETAVANNSRTLDDLVREMLQPMLKAWLDNNLPWMVERLVRSEIERIASPRSIA
jgi:cell pole-organizing protein PopZ